MAIVKCVECGKDVSDKADNCIHCGAPLKKQTAFSKIKTFLKWVLIGFGVLFLLVAILAINQDPKSEINETTDETTEDSGIDSSGDTPPEEVPTENYDSDVEKYSEEDGFDYGSVIDEGVQWDELNEVADEAKNKKAEMETKKCENLKCRVENASLQSTVECQPEIEKLAAYDFEWINKWYEPIFDRYVGVEDNKDHVILLGDKIKFQNGFGAWANMIYACKFDLITNEVVQVEFEPGRL